MPMGLHVAYLTIVAAIAGTPIAQMAIKHGAKADFFINPAAIAEECFHMMQQDRSAWTFIGSGPSGRPGEVKKERAQILRWSRW